MAYYNPTEGIKGYYEPSFNPASVQITDDQNSSLPEQFENIKQSPTQSISDIFKNIAGGLLVFGIGTAVLRTGSKQFLNQAIRGVAGRANEKSVVSYVTSIFRKNKILQQSAENIVSKAEMGNINFKQVAEEIPLIKQTLDKYTKFTEPAVKAYQNYYSTTKTIEETLYKQGEFNKIRFQHEKLKEYWKTKDFGKRFLGSVEKFSTDYLKTLPAFYAVNRIATMGKEPDRPSLLNIPGTILDFTKFSISWLPMELGFKGAMKAFQLGRIGIANGLKKSIEPYKPQINKFYDRLSSTKAYDSIGKAQQHIHAFSKAVSYVNNDITHRFESNFVGKAETRSVLRRQKSLFDTSELKQTWKSAKEVYSNELRSAKSSYESKKSIDTTLNLNGKNINFKGIDEEFKNLIDISNQLGLRGRSRGPTKINSLGLFKEKHNLSTTGYILGSKLAKRLDAPVKLRRKYTIAFKEIEKAKILEKGELKNLKETFWNSTYSKPVWKIGKSKIADFSAYHPVNLLKNSLHAVKNLSIKVPFMRAAFTPYNMLLGDTFFGRTPNFHIFSSQKSQYFDHIENYKLNSHLDTAELMKPRSEGSFMVHTNNKFFMYDHGENKFYQPEVIRNKSYLLRPSTDKLQANQARELLFNQDPGKLKLVKKMYGKTQSKFKSWWYKFADKQEIGAGFGDTKSLLFRAKGYLEDKLFGARSDVSAAYDTLNDKNLLDKITNGQVGLGEAINPMKILMAAGKSANADEARVVLNPKVLSRIAGNSTLRINGKDKNIVDVLFNNKDLIDFHKENFVSAPKHVKNIVNRYSSDHHVLNEINHGYPKIGKPLTNLEVLRFEALKETLIQNAQFGKRVFGDIPSRFLNDLSKQTGLSKFELSAINHFGLSTELEALYRKHPIQTLNGVPINRDEFKDFTNKFTSKIKDFENNELMSLSSYLTKMTGRKKADELLLSSNKVIAQKMGITPYVAIEKSMAGIGGTAYTYVMERLANMGGLFGLGMDTSRYAGTAGITKYWGKRVLQFAALAGAYNVADTFFDVNPLFNKTMLDEGLTVAAAEQFSKIRLATAKIMDLTGITKASQYMEGLMPGSTTTFPGALIGGMVGGPIGVPAGMILNRMIGTYFNWDLTKSYDQLKDIYAGREKVPIRHGRFWELSKTPYEGGRIEYYSPSWFHLLKSQYKNNPALYGGKLEGLMLTKPWTGLGFNPFGLLVDKYALERQQWAARPYPLTSPAGEDIPLFGPLVAGTIGRIIKPIKEMHPMELQQSYNGIPGGQWQEALLSQVLSNNNMDINSSSAVALRGGYSKPVNPYDLYGTIGKQIYNFTEAAGLLGFISENTVLRGGIGEAKAQLSTAGDMSSLSRSYWDQSLGGGLFTTEFFRRLIPRDRPEIEKRNSLRNQMPQWLPGIGSNYFINFSEGDPYTKIPKSEARIPGFGYESLHNVKYAFPGRASALGNNIPDTVSQMLGIGTQTSIDEDDIMQEGTAMHRAIQNNLKLNNLLIKDEALVYDARHDISGHVDAIVRDGTGGGGKRAIEIKTINSKDFSTLVAPRNKHRSQLNFYLSQLKLPVGNIVYVNRDDPSQVKSFTQYFSKDLLEKDIIKLEQSRNIASNLLRNNVRGQQIGDAYSHLDRVEILGDVAPYSKEYKEEMQIVQMQQKAGLLDVEEQRKIQTIKKHRSNVMRRFDFYPRRFSLGQLMDPDPNYTQMNINENIKAAAEYPLPERILGGVYETFSHADVPLINKFWGYKTPLEHYQENVMYGSDKCLHPDTKILGNTIKKIKDINIGDIIVDHLGNKQKVLNKVINKIKDVDQEKLLSINIFGNYNSLMVTKHHNLLKYENNNIVEIHGKDIKVNDYVPFPIYKVRNDISIIDLMNYSNNIENKLYNDEFIWTNRSKNKIPRFIALDYDFGILLGWYLAEGNIIYNHKRKEIGIQFSMNNKEKDKIFELEQLINLKFNIKSKRIIPKSGNGIYIKFYNRYFANLLKLFCNEYSNNKKINEEIINKELLKGIFYGLIYGDGHINNKEHRITLSTVNENILYLLRYYFTSLNIFGTISKRIAPTNHTINTKICKKIKDSYVLRFSGKSFEEGIKLLKYKSNYKCNCERNNYIFKDEYLLLKVTQITEIEYFDEVCDLTIENTSTFSTIFCSVHNSFWTKPYESFIEPAMRGMLSQNEPLGGISKWAIPGFLMGGPVGAIGMGAAGAMYGGFRGLSKKAYIPDIIKQQRDIGTYFDQIEYEKNKRLFEQTSDDQFMEKMNQTMTGYNTSFSGKSFSNLFKAVQRPEKDYLEGFLKTSNPLERNEILKLVPDDLKGILKNKWGMGDNINRGFTQNEDYFKTHKLPDTNWPGWGQNLPVQDYQVVTMKQECFIPEQEILTINGIKQIKDISIFNDNLFNGNGELKCPLKLWKKEYTGPILKIKFRKTIFELNGTPNHNLEINKKCWGFNNFKEKQLKDLKINNKVKLSSYNFPEDIVNIYEFKVTKELGFILGWFLAEGSFLSEKGILKGIQFTLSNNEIEIANKLKNNIKLVFNKEAKIYKRKSSTSGNDYISVSFFSRDISQIIYSLCGKGLQDKILSKTIFRFPLFVIKEIIHNWFKGDGYISKKNNWNSNEIYVSTNSKQLAVQGWYIMRSVGISVSLRYIKPKLNKKESYRICLSRKEDQKLFYNEWKYIKFTTLSIKSIKILNYSGNIYDITMPKNHYYNTACCTVHNSLDAHDVGMGWYDQERRIANSPWKVNPIDINETSELPSIDKNQLQNIIYGILRKYNTFGNISVIPINNSNNDVNLTVSASVDRRKDMIKAIRGY